MTYVAYRLYGGKDETGILSIAASQELLHLSMLIHDDIIDRDYVRYGVKNIHGSFDEVYAPLISDDDERRHYASSAALLGGDLLLSSAYDIVTGSTLPDAKKILALTYLSNSVFNVVGGELLDTEASFRPHDQVDPIKIALFKTSSYSFIAPLCSGAAIAGASDTELENMSSFGEALGIAFQLADDLLGVFGDEQVTGKSTTSDISEGKFTLLVKEALNLADEADRTTLQSLLGKHDISNEEAEQVRSIFVRSGAKASIERSIETYALAAHAALAKLDGSEQYKQELAHLITRATKRSK
jgi:geranylgeranyl diphosphate synthase type II